MDPQIYHAILLVPAFLLWVSVLITVWRIITGPNSLDRLVGMDGFYRHVPMRSGDLYVLVARYLRGLGHAGHRAARLHLHRVCYQV